jgi:hypothetical protein
MGSTYSYQHLKVALTHPHTVAEKDIERDIYIYRQPDRDTEREVER